MSASFSNVVMIGMPLSLNLYGEAAAAPIAILVSLHSPLLWTMASIHLGLSRRDGKLSVAAIGRDLIVELSRNIIILSIVAGTLWRLSGLGFDPLADDIITLLGRAGIPCALISLGLSLLGFRIAGQVPTLVDDPFAEITRDAGDRLDRGVSSVRVAAGCSRCRHNLCGNANRRQRLHICIAQQSGTAFRIGCCRVGYVSIRRDGCRGDLCSESYSGR